MTRDTPERLIDAALAVIDQHGAAGFSTRAVCEIAGVKAPSLYHHFGSIDGLLSAAIDRSFEAFVGAKSAAETASDPVTVLRDGWDDLVAFAASHPRLYAAMTARVMSGASIPHFHRLIDSLAATIARIDAAGQLTMTPSRALHVAWASATGASMLVAAPAFDGDGPLSGPDRQTLDTLRERAIGTIWRGPE